MAEKTFAEKLTDILAQQGAITEDENKALEKVYKEADKGNFVHFLLDEGIVEETALLHALGTYYKVPAFDVVGYFFDHELLQKFPEEILITKAFIPLQKDENILVVVASKPDDSDLLLLIGDHVSYDIRFLVGIERDIVDMVRDFYEKSPTDVEVDIDSREERQMEKVEKSLEQRDDEFIDSDKEK